MARRVFFSFHYDRDVWRASVVRNSWMTQDREEAGFFDASLWEEARREGEAAIKRLIDRGLENTTVTAVLIGSQTASRSYVGYEIDQSCRRGNGLVGIYVHNILDRTRARDTPGANPLDAWYIERAGARRYLSQLYSTYDWVADDGYRNLGAWVEAATRKSNSI
jgi:hypothetical protein